MDWNHVLHTHTYLQVSFISLLYPQFISHPLSHDCVSLTANLLDVKAICSLLTGCVFLKVCVYVGVILIHFFFSVVTEGKKLYYVDGVLGTYEEHPLSLSLPPARLSKEYIKWRFLPRYAHRLLDEKMSIIGSRMYSNNPPSPPPPSPG